MKQNSRHCLHSFALGTAQLGMSYGVANRHGKPDMAVATEIIKRARAAGCRYYDTAAGYGDAEQVLGTIFAELGMTAHVDVISKCALRSENRFEVGEIRSVVQQSLDKLQVPALWALLLHREADLSQWSSGLGSELLGLREAGLVQRLGVSSYQPQHTRQAAALAGLDVFQVPASIFDRRFVADGCLDKLVNSGKSVFLRSVFLQGLALLERTALPTKMNFAAPAVQALEEFCRDHEIARCQFALDYVRLRCPGTVLLFGAERPEQVAENLKTLEQVQATVALCDEWDQRWPTSHDEAMSPLHWPK